MLHISQLFYCNHMPIAWPVNRLISQWFVVCQWASYQIRKFAGCAWAGNAWNAFPATDFKGNRLLAIPACITARITHVPWCMVGSLSRGGGENVPGIPGAWATRNFTYLARGPWDHRELCWMMCTDDLSIMKNKFKSTNPLRLHYAKYLLETLKAFV